MRRRVLLTTILLGLSGCSILPERPPVKLYGLLTDYTPEPLSSVRKRLSSVRVNSPMVAAPYDSVRCYVMGKGNRLFSTQTSSLSAEPGVLIGESFRSYLDINGPWKNVLAPNSLSTPTDQITIYVNKFFVNASQEPFTAIIQMEVSVNSTETGKVLFHKTYSAEERVTEKGISGCISAFEEGLKDIYKKICIDLNNRGKTI